MVDECLCLSIFNVKPEVRVPIADKPSLGGAELTCNNLIPGSHALA